MENKTVSEIASKQLDRVLGFFPRVESKISALFAVDAAMLALLALNVKTGDLAIWFLALFNVCSVIAIGSSIFFLYKASYPQLKGGSKSLVYFREIAGRTEVDYVKAVRTQKEDGYVDDLLGQVWRNSDILVAKYDSLKFAFISVAIAVPLWFSALLSASIHHATLVVK